MRAFWMSVAEAKLYFELKGFLNAQTEQECEAILQAMAEEGFIANIVETTKTKDDYIKHISEKFGSVMNISKGDSNNGNPCR